MVLLTTTPIMKLKTAMFKKRFATAASSTQPPQRYQTTYSPRNAPDTYLQVLTKLKQTSTTTKTYHKYITRLNKELREARARVQLRISIFLAMYPLVSTLSLSTWTLLLDPTFFDRSDDLVIAFFTSVSRLRETNYI